MTVELCRGVYELLPPLELTGQDSGTEDAPIVYRAADGASLKIGGGREVTGWKRVTDPAVLDRLHKSARHQVWQADLKALVVQPVGPDTGLTGFDDRTMAALAECVLAEVVSS